MKLLIFFLLSQSSLIELGNRYLKNGQYESAIKVFSEIYRTSEDKSVRALALFSRAKVRIKMGDTLYAITDLETLKKQRLMDTLSFRVYSMLANITPDTTRKIDYLGEFVKLYPEYPQRQRLMQKILNLCKITGDSTRMLHILQMLSSDYGGVYSSKLAPVYYAITGDKRIMPYLIKSDSSLLFNIYLERGDTARAIGFLLTHRGIDTKIKLVKFFYQIGAYKKAMDNSRGILGRRGIADVYVESGVKLGYPPDSFARLVPFIKDSVLKYYALCSKNLTKYERLLAEIQDSRVPYLLSIIYRTNKDYLNLLKIVDKIRYRTYTDTLKVEIADYLFHENMNAWALKMLNGVQYFYPIDSVDALKKKFASKKLSPTGILFADYTPLQKVRYLFQNGDYNLVIAYLKGKKIDRFIAPYLINSLITEGLIHKDNTMLNEVEKMFKVFSPAKDRRYYLLFRANYHPEKFALDDINYDKLGPDEIDNLYKILKVLGKVQIIKDVSGLKRARFYYYIEKGDFDSTLAYMPENSNDFYYMFLKRFQNIIADSLRHIRNTKFAPLQRHAREIFAILLDASLRAKDYDFEKDLLSRYRSAFGADSIFAEYTTVYFYAQKEYENALYWSLFSSSEQSQLLRTKSLVHMNLISSLVTAAMDDEARNLLYLNIGLFDRIDPNYIGEESLLPYLKLAVNTGNTRKGFAFLKFLQKNKRISKQQYYFYRAYCKSLRAQLDTSDINRIKDRDKIRPIFYNIGKAMMHRALLDTALFYFKLSIGGQDSICGLAFFKIGTIYYMQNKYRKAAMSYEKAARVLDGQDRELALFNAALCAKKAQDNINAIKLYSTYLTSCLDCESIGDAYLSRAFVQLQADKGKDVTAPLDSVSGILGGENEAELLYWMGESYLADSAFKEALSGFLRMYYFHKNYSNWRDTGGLNAARMYRLLGFKSRAISIYRDIAARRSDVIGRQARKELLDLKNE